MRIALQRLKQSASSSQWLQRQAVDHFTRQARVDNFKSRAAYKLLQMDKKFRLFKPGMTVVDLGYAPGSWSQVAVQQTQPNGRVIGVDLLQAEPPVGVTAVQGNFLSTMVQEELKRLIENPDVGRTNKNLAASSVQPVYASERHAEAHKAAEETARQARYAHRDGDDDGEIDAIDGALQDLDITDEQTTTNKRQKKKKAAKADLVLSDMCGILPQTSGFWINSINSPYERLANTSGLIVRDHASSMDLCDAGLMFCLDNLKTRGAFVCKFYTGSEDKELEERLKKVFRKVHRVKPDASRKESREAYFVALQKRAYIKPDAIF